MFDFLKFNQPHNSNNYVKKPNVIMIKKNAY